jgi:hypothetical protein
MLNFLNILLPSKQGVAGSNPAGIANRLLLLQPFLSVAVRADRIGYKGVPRPLQECLAQ